LAYSAKYYKKRSYVCIVRAIEAYLRTIKSLEELKAKDFKDFPTVKKVLGRIKKKDASNTAVTYQGTDASTSSFLFE